MSYLFLFLHQSLQSFQVLHPISQLVNDFLNNNCYLESGFAHYHYTTKNPYLIWIPTLLSIPLFHTYVRILTLNTYEILFLCDLKTVELSLQDEVQEVFVSLTEWRTNCLARLLSLHTIWLSFFPLIPSFHSLFSTICRIN